MAELLLFDRPGTSTDQPIETIDAEAPSKFRKLILQRINGAASKPSLSGVNGSVLDFGDSSFSLSRGRNALNMLDVLSKKCASKEPKSGVNQHLSLQTWKANIEKMMKSKREEEMNKRQELYRLEQEQVHEETEEQELESESETDLNYSDDEEEADAKSTDYQVEEQLDKPDTIRSDQELNLFPPQPTIERNECNPVITQSQETELNLHLYLDTEEVDTDVTMSPRHELKMDEQMTTQQAKDEVMLLLTNPFDKYDASEKCNKSQSDIFPLTPSQSQPSLSNENDSSCLVLQPESAADLKMEKQLTSQQAEREVMDLLTNPFRIENSSNSFTLTSSLRKFDFSLSPTIEQSADVKKRVKPSPLDDDDGGNALDGFDFDIKRKRFKKLFVSEDDDEEHTMLPNDKPQNSSGDKQQNIENSTHQSITSDQEQGTDCEERGDGENELDEMEDELGSMGSDDESDEENEIVDDEIVKDEEDEEEKLAMELRANRFVDKKTKLIRREFVEHEAELSGSEVDSDEDDEVNSEEDELEAEEGDLEDLPPDDELRAQVEKIHNKQMLDDDKRRLLMYKDAYLPDGDMHSDADVLRRFRWRKADDEEINFDRGIEADEDEVQIVEEEGVESWTQLQKERAQFLLDKGLKSEEFEEQSLDADADTCELFRLNRINIRRSTSSTAAVSFAATTAVESEEKSAFVTSSVQACHRTGRESFLHREHSVLSRIINEGSNSGFSCSAPIKSLFFSEKCASVEDPVDFTTLKNRRRKIQNAKNEKPDSVDKEHFGQDSIFSLL